MSLVLNKITRPICESELDAIGRTLGVSRARGIGGNEKFETGDDEDGARHERGLFTLRIYVQTVRDEFSLYHPVYACNSESGRRVCEAQLIFPRAELRLPGNVMRRARCTYQSYAPATNAHNSSLVSVTNFSLNGSTNSGIMLASDCAATVINISRAERFQEGYLRRAAENACARRNRAAGCCRRRWSSRKQRDRTFGWKRCRKSCRTYGGNKKALHEKPFMERPRQRDAWQRELRRGFRAIRRILSSRR